MGIIVATDGTLLPVGPDTPRKNLPTYEVDHNSGKLTWQGMQPDGAAPPFQGAAKTHPTAENKKPSTAQ